MSHAALRQALHPGFLLMEVLVGIAVFALFISAISYTLLYGQENTILAGDRSRASYIAEQALEGARSIRDGSFASITAGTRAVRLNASSQWVFSGSSVTLTGSYLSSVVITQLASDWMQLTAQSKWKHGYQRAGTASLVTELTNWRAAGSIGNWGGATLQGSFVDGSNPAFNHIAVAGNYAYATSNYGAGAKGLYILDISNLASPVRVSSNFDLGYAAYDVLIRGKRLYVLTSDPNAELKVYNIATPTSFTSANLVTSYDLPGSGLGRGMSVARSLLYVGAQYSATAGQYELYSFDVSNSGAVVLKSALDESDSTNAVALSGTAALLASAIDTGELQVVNAQASGGLLQVGSYNLTDRTLDGMSIAAAGTSALLGTMKGDSIQEMVLFDTSPTGVPAPANAWYHEGSGSLLGVDMDGTRCYAFLAADSGRKAFQAVNMRNKSTLTEVYSYNSVNGNGRGIFYDLVRDRIFLLTASAVLIFQPGAPPSACG